MATYFCKNQSPCNTFYYSQPKLHRMLCKFLSSRKFFIGLKKKTFSKDILKTFMPVFTIDLVLDSCFELLLVLNYIICILERRTKQEMDSSG